MALRHISAMLVILPIGGDMSVGYRNFIVHADQTIEAISHRTFDAFFFRNEPALPHFANQAINLATVFYRLKNRKPEQIIHQLENQRFHVTADGSLDQDRINEAILLKMKRAGWGSSSGAPTGQGPVIDATARFDESMRPYLT